MALGGLLTLAVAAGGAVGAMATRGKPLGEFFFGPNLARAEVVLVQKGVVRDYRVDRGRVRSVRGGNLELRELDGAIQVVPVSPTALVTINGQPTVFAVITRGMVVTTVREGSNPAHQVHVTIGKR
jgi:hypothetical protein